MSAASVTAAQLFEQAKAISEGIRREAVRVATAAYVAARKQQLHDWGIARAAARQAFEAVKGEPNHPEHTKLRDAVRALEIQPSSKPLRDQLDVDIRAADRQYHEALTRLRVEHGLKPVF